MKLVNKHLFKILIKLSVNYFQRLITVQDGLGTWRPFLLGTSTTVSSFTFPVQTMRSLVIKSNMRFFRDMSIYFSMAW